MPMSLKALTLTTLSLLTLGLGMSACETVEGAGEDIEHAGETIQDTAN